MKFLFIWTTLLIGYVYGQTIELNGTVRDGEGFPIEGAVIRLISSDLLDTTGSDGAWSLMGTSNVILRGAERHSGFVRARGNELEVYVTGSALMAFEFLSLQGKRVTTVSLPVSKPGIIKIPFPREISTYWSIIMSYKIGNDRRTARLVKTFSGWYMPESEHYPARLSKVAAAAWLRASKQGYVTLHKKLDTLQGTVDITLETPLSGPALLGPNVFIFNPEDSPPEVQNRVDAVFNEMERDQFGEGRYCFIFMPGQYNVDINVGYYTQVLGTGMSPGDVVINGAVRAEADWFNGNSTHNFWRAAENMTVNPSSGSNRWAVSQADPFRRMHIKGDLQLDDGGWASGGFLADSKVDGSINSGSQQQWFTRNSEMENWNGQVWNMFFLGVEGAPSGDGWPNPPYTVIGNTPRIREKPFLTVNETGNFSVFVPSVSENTHGPSWITVPTPGEYISLDRFHIARPETDGTSEIDAALAQGLDLLLTPGIYMLDGPIHITRPGTIVLGLGFPSLVPQNGTAVMEVDDVDGVVLAGFLLDAGPQDSPTLLQIGVPGISADHSSNPSSIHDVFCRIGGQFTGRASGCITIHSNDVIGDHFWLWRADHGTFTRWDENVSKNGLVVEGNNVNIYGLFVEHFHEYQTVWNGENGLVHFYQSEMPYRPDPSWGHDGVGGYAAYKVGDHVQAHQATGLGIYCTFHNDPIKAGTAIEVPDAPGISMNRMLTVWLDGNDGSEITNVVNDEGGSATKSNRLQRVEQYP